MKVCDVCWSPNDLVQVDARYNEVDMARRRFVWFGESTDFCPTCLKLLENKDFQELGKRAHDAILDRAGLAHLHEEAPDARQPAQP